VEETPKGPRLILSRADPLFVAALFKLEVPEINQGIVDIRAVSREVGGRTKLAVSSRDESIDPVGACVGLKGSRVRAVVQELGGERIDIVPWHPDPEIFAKRALAPARVAKVISDYEARTMTAIVDEDQLSLAIGRNGQNVRLASQLIGWQLDLYGSREWLEHGAERALFGGGDEGEFESADFPLGELDLPPATLAALQAAGYNTFYDIIDLDRDDLLRIPAINAADAERIAQLIEEMTVEEEDAGAAAAAPGAPEGDASAGGEPPAEASAEGGAGAETPADAGAADEDGEGEGLTRRGAAENLASSD
jgi:N utilization substance protein A